MRRAPCASKGTQTPRAATRTTCAWRKGAQTRFAIGSASKAAWPASTSQPKASAPRNRWRRTGRPMAAMILRDGRRTGASRLSLESDARRESSLLERQGHRRANPRELLVEVDSQHLAAGESDEVLRQYRLAFVIGPQKHHADLDLHSAAVRGHQSGRVFDFFLQAPLVALRGWNSGQIVGGWLDIHSPS